MPSSIQPAVRWIATLASVALIVVALGFRSPDAPRESQEPEASATAVPLIVAAGAAPADGELTIPRLPPVPAATHTPSPPTPAPMLEPTPPPTPAPAAEAPPVAPPPDDGAGGGLVPRTAPPGWTPPAQLPGDIWTTGAFGQTLSAGGITVTVHRLPLEPNSAGCNDGSPLPAGYAWAGFTITTTWSGFPIPTYGAGAPNVGLVSCWIGSPSPLVTGVTYMVYLQVPANTAATTSMNIGYFPYGKSPAYIFDFH